MPFQSRYWLVILFHVLIAFGYVTLPRNSWPAETPSPPWGAVGFIYQKGQKANCWLIESNIAVTNRHVIGLLIGHENLNKTGFYNWSSSDEGPTVKFQNSELTISEALWFTKSPAYTVIDDAPDIAILILRPEQSTSKPLKWFGTPNNAEVVLIGWEWGLQCGNACPQLGFSKGTYNSKTSHHTSQTVDGLSGSPILTYVDGEYRVMAVHARKNLTQDIFMAVPCDSAKTAVEELIGIYYPCRKQSTDSRTTRRTATCSTPLSIIDKFPYNTLYSRHYTKSDCSGAVIMDNGKSTGIGRHTCRQIGNNSLFLSCDPSWDETVPSAMYCEDNNCTICTGLMAADQCFSDSWTIGDTFVTGSVTYYCNLSDGATYNFSFLVAFIVISVLWVVY